MTKKETPFKETRDSLAAWFKSSAKHLKNAASSFVKETKKFIDEARDDYEKSKKTKQQP